MDDQSQLPPRVSWFAVWRFRRRWIVTAVLLLVIVGYPLSFGPAFGLLYSGWLNSHVFVALYQPLMSLAKEIDFISRWLYWYASYFMPTGE